MAHSSNTKESTSGMYSDPHDARDTFSASSGSTNGSIVLKNPNTLIQLINRLPEYVRKISWEVQKELAKKLNQLKDPVCNDWRLVASRLSFTVAEIDVFTKSTDPTMEMLKLCNTTSTEELFGIIQDIGRSDVIEDLLAYLNRLPSSPSRLPTQESLEDKTSQPFEESFSDISKLSKQPSEQEDNEEDIENVFRRFICSEESKSFWKSIQGPHDEKKWPDFWSATLTACKEESQHGGIDRFLCHVFKIDYDERQDGKVRLDFFLRLLAFFGPFKSGENGCLKKMHDLIKKSVSKSTDGQKHSWFAGYMNKEETEKRLSETTPGRFLIRFSGSKVDDGWFVLAVRTIEGVVQIEIEKDTDTNKLHFAGESFPDLVAIVDKLRREVILQECRQLLINPCPDLPLNGSFSGYTTATRLRGRGRGRLR